MQLQMRSSYLKTFGLEPWQVELAEFVIKAEKENKLILQPHYDLVFTPEQLAGYLMQGRFVWGVVNWKLIEASPENLKRLTK